MCVSWSAEAVLTSVQEYQISCSLFMWEMLSAGPLSVPVTCLARRMNPKEAEKKVRVRRRCFTIPEGSRDGPLVRAATTDVLSQ